MGILYVVLTVLGYLYALWAAYIIVMGAYRAKLDGRLVGAVKFLAYPLVIVGILMDVLCQYTIATAIFWDKPAKGEYMLTARLQRYIKAGSGWRSEVASNVCKNLLDIFDPSGNHCHGR